MTEIFEVTEGDVFLDGENGRELTVVKLCVDAGCALLEDQNGEEQAMLMEKLLDAIYDGKLFLAREEGDAPE